MVLIDQQRFHDAGFVDVKVVKKVLDVGIGDPGVSIH